MTPGDASADGDAKPQQKPAKAAANGRAGSKGEYDTTQKSMDVKMREGTLARARSRRDGVSAEQRANPTSGSITIKASTAGHKSAEVRAMLGATVMEGVLFGGLSATQREMVIDAMVQTECTRGQVIIRQGDREVGSLKDNFYVVGEGHFDIFKRMDESPPPDDRVESLGELVQQRDPGDAFGELALMYNVARQASVVCTSPAAVLWALPRKVFVDIQQSEAIDSSEAILETLQGCDLLQALDAEAFDKLYHSAEVIQFVAGDRIIRQGDPGDAFYIILAGSVKCVSESAPNDVLMTLSRREYFGASRRAARRPRRPPPPPPLLLLPLLPLLLPLVAAAGCCYCCCCRWFLLPLLLLLLPPPPLPVY